MSGGRDGREHTWDAAWNHDALRGVRPRTVTVITAGYDPDRAGVGSGPGNDPSNNALFVPQFVPVSGDRFLFRLAAIYVPAGYYAMLLDLAQLVTIAQPFTLTSGGMPPVVLGTTAIEREVLSPLWSPTDGNVLWGVTALAMGAVALNWGNSTSAPLLNPSVSNSFYETTPALLAIGDVTAAAYAAPAGGEYPGDDVAGLSRLYTHQAPWTAGSTLRQRYTVHGPVMLTFWASLQQTDPLTRLQIPQASLPPVADRAGWRQEDQFLYSFGDAGAQGPNRVRYRHIAGRMQVEVGPAEFLCSEEERRARLTALHRDAQPQHHPSVAPLTPPAICPGEPLK